jgi:hypothetical protein
MRFAPVIAAVVLASCNSAPHAGAPTPSRHVDLTGAQIARLKNDVARGLKDPDSARFGATFRAAESGGQTLVCGYVNAKNSYGGYVGEKPFIAAGDGAGGFSLVGVGGRIYGVEDIGTLAVKEHCAKYGITI